MASSVIRGSAAALVIKFTASILGFVMFALASREMGLEAFGSVAVIFNAMSFLAVVALWGQETLIIRSWSEYCDSDRPGLARGALSASEFLRLPDAWLLDEALNARLAY